MGEEVTVTATVLDDESPVDDLTYIWAVTSGTLYGNRQDCEVEGACHKPDACGVQDFADGHR